MSTEKKTKEEVDVIEKETNKFELILFNDDVNTFDHVINCLIEICDHNAEQAEQCSLIVHHKGKCTVKSGEYNDLKRRCTRLLDRDLSAEII